MGDLPLSAERRQALAQFVAGFAGCVAEAVDWSLLHRALIHPSWSAEAGGPDNDRLEFLGDEVLRLLAAAYLYTRYPDLDVGQLTAVRSVLVSDAELAQLAEHYRLGDYLLVGRSAVGDERGRPTRLADGLEAVVGALYLSTGDWQLVRGWLEPYFERLSQAVLADPARGNHKSALQELLQKRTGGELPEYRLLADGPPFTYAVWALGQCWGTGSGPSKKQAQQEAARQAYEALRSSFAPPADAL